MPAVKPAQAVRGQYGAGTVLGKTVKAYRQEPDVAPDSNIETYVAMRLEIDNWRWAGVPFYIRTGKHMSQRNTEIAIRFKQAPYAAFQDTPVDTLRPNWLVLRIAPDEGISLQFEVKRPGPVVDLAAVKMDFRYDDWFPKEPNVGYETLLYDVMIGDPTLFMRADMVEHDLAHRAAGARRLGQERRERICRFIPREAQDRAKRTRFWRVMAGTGAPSTVPTPKNLQ